MVLLPGVGVKLPQAAKPGTTRISGDAPQVSAARNAARLSCAVLNIADAIAALSATLGKTVFR